MKLFLEIIGSIGSIIGYALLISFLMSSNSWTTALSIGVLAILFVAFPFAYILLYTTIKNVIKICKK